jgi:hypothetical protein
LAATHTHVEQKPRNGVWTGSDSKWNGSPCNQITSLPLSV